MSIVGQKVIASVQMKANPVFPQQCAELNKLQSFFDNWKINAA